MKTPAQERWNQLWRSAGLTGDADVHFQALTQFYSAPDRYYHNLQHVAECLREFDVIRHEAKQPTAVELAIWFHDSIYDSHAHNNEEQSADLAREWLRDAQGDEQLIGLACELIMATRHVAAPEDTDARLMADVDLSILGQEENRFQQYEHQIRQEYLWVPETIFAAKRAEILEGFLARERIFFTEMFFERYEATARRNLLVSIRRWKAIS